jgi:DnaJ-class molecular chaperone
MSRTTFAIKRITCAFCKGTGNDPFDLLSDRATCQVCKGTGKVEVKEPAIKCVYCKESGVYHNTRITCTVCNGKGVVTAPKGASDQCVDCGGTGRAIDSAMPCLKCRGKGLVSR